MSKHALFSGLVVDEHDQAVTDTLVGEEAFYVINDQGFMHHVPSEAIDRHVLQQMAGMLSGHEEELSKQAAQMMGQDDIFTQAAILNQLKNVDEQFDQLLAQGLPEASRTYLGMSGFKIRVNHRGEVLEVLQPGQIAPEDEE